MQPAWAEITESTFSATKEAIGLNSSPIITFGYVFQLFLSLAVVIGLIYFTAKYVLPKFKVGGGTGVIQIIDRVMLEPQVASYVLKIKGKVYVVMVSSKNVIVLDQYKDEGIT
ncbi:MAG: hypothetical protein V1843_04780 [bacterium]